MYFHSTHSLQFRRWIVALFRKFSLLIEGPLFEGAKSFSFLGVRLDWNLNWGEKIKALESKLASGVFAVWRWNKLGSIPLLKTVILNHMSPTVLWGAVKKHINKIISWQKKGIRAMLRLPPRTSCRETFINLQIMTVTCL